MANVSLPHFSALSPSNNPILNSQRDHSSCGQASSPLRVRKTRENLRRENQMFADVPPPCLRHYDIVTTTGAWYNEPSEIDSVKSKDDLRETGNAAPHILTPTSPRCRPYLPIPSALQSDTSQQMPRHESVSRRMLTRVKNGISHRSKSSQSIRDMHTGSGETGLLRRISSKRRQSREMERAYQTDQPDRPSLEGISEQAVIAMQSRRSTSSLAVSSSEVFESPMLTLLSTEDPVIKHDEFLRSTTPLPQSRSPSPDPTPRGSAIGTSKGSYTDNGSAFQSFAVPYVNLEVSLSHTSIDSNLAREVWVAVEATIRVRTCEAFLDPGEVEDTTTRPVDAIIVLCQDLEAHDVTVMWQFMSRLTLRLNNPSDRMAILRLTSSSHQENCQLLHPLQYPDLRIPSLHNPLFPQHQGSDNRESINGSSTLQHVLQTLLDQGLRQNACHFFVATRRPNPLTQVLSAHSNWSVHTITINPNSGVSTKSQHTSHRGWRLELNDYDRLNSELLAELCRDMRRPGCASGVTSLRICFKALLPCRILQVIGQKALKSVRPGQQCCLLLRVQIPRVPCNSGGAAACPDSEFLLTELQSLVGILETDVLHVEARYRHSILPQDNIVSIRHTVTVKRPRSDSRWSITESMQDVASPAKVYCLLARYVTCYQTPRNALKLMSLWIPPQYMTCSYITRLQKRLEAALSHSMPGFSTDTLPCRQASLTMNNYDTNLKDTRCVHGSSAGIAVATLVLPPVQTLPQNSFQACFEAEASASHTASKQNEASEPSDAARRLWRHIRRSSYPADQVFELSSSEKASLADDEAVMELQSRALANKRSIGAETLRDWKWEHKAARNSDAPWL